MDEVGIVEVVEVVDEVGIVEVVIEDVDEACVVSDPE